MNRLDSKLFYSFRPCTVSESQNANVNLATTRGPNSLIFEKRDTMTSCRNPTSQTQKRHAQKIQHMLQVHPTHTQNPHDKLLWLKFPIKIFRYSYRQFRIKSGSGLFTAIPRRQTWPSTRSSESTRSREDDRAPTSGWWVERVINRRMFAISAPRADTWWNQAGASHRAVGLWQFEGAVVNLQTPGPTIWRRSDEYAAVLKKDRNQWRRGIADSQLLHRQKCRG